MEAIHKGKLDIGYWFQGYTKVERVGYIAEVSSLLLVLVAAALVSIVLPPLAQLAIYAVLVYAVLACMCRRAEDAGLKSYVGVVCMLAPLAASIYQPTLPTGLFFVGYMVILAVLPSKR